MNILAVIPARWGSNRITRKNTRLLCGKPLIAHTLLHASRSQMVNRVVVSTDGDDISKISKEYGAEVVCRPKEISSDKASSESAIIHVLKHLKEVDSYIPNIVVFLQCTSPVREDDDIDNAINIFIKQEADSLFSACRFNKYIWKLADKNIMPINYDYRNRWREQDFPVQYMENGSIYIFKPWVVNVSNNRLGGNIVIYEMSQENSFQIDSIEDLKFCEFILKGRKKND